MDGAIQGAVVLNAEQTPTHHDDGGERRSDGNFSSIGHASASAADRTHLKSADGFSVDQTLSD